MQVFLVRERQQGKIYAMKVLNKSNIIKRNQASDRQTTHTHTRACKKTPTSFLPTPAVWPDSMHAISRNANTL